MKDKRFSSNLVKPMDSTAKILEMMDGTQFEKICGPILRKMIPELKNLIPSGINVDGRVIKSLADGFRFDKTYYATVHITTNTSHIIDTFIAKKKLKDNLSSVLMEA